MNDRVNRTYANHCLTGRIYHEGKKYIHYSNKKVQRGPRAVLSGVDLMNVGLYLPKKKADTLGLTRSPQAEFFGFCSRRGPVSPMIRAPTGAVSRMPSTATVSTSMPYFFNSLSSFNRAMSKAVEPMAA